MKQLDSIVINHLDPIEDLYNIYSEEKVPQIVEVLDNISDLDIEGPADPYMDL